MKVSSFLVGDIPSHGIIDADLLQDKSCNKRRIIDESNLVECD